jgi:ABC-type branched-subunit amino acid transport system ATPase component
VLLEVVDLSKTFGGIAAVSHASFGVAERSITALIGPNGAGKTTMFNLLTGLIRADSGMIRFAGRSIERLRTDLVARAGLVRVFQSPRILTRMTVRENMMLAAKDQPGERFGMAWMAPARVARREAEIRAQAENLLGLLRLSHLAEAFAGTLSGGQRKLLELGRTLMVEPRMILLDEPMAGVAPVLAEQLLEHVKMLRAQRGITVCIIEHDLDLIMSVSDHVVVMDEGTVIASGSPAEVQADGRVIEAYIGRLDAAVVADAS